MIRLALAAAWGLAWAFGLVLFGTLARVMVELLSFGYNLW